MPDPVEKFRSLTGRRQPGDNQAGKPAIPARESALVALILVNMAWLMFAMGGVRPWGEIPAAILSVGSLALLPRWEKGEIEGPPGPVFRLLRCPLFWLGFGMFFYIWIQTWNTAWEWTVYPDGKPKLISKNPLFGWLPAGAMTPLEENNPVRAMAFMAIPWMSAAAVWAGLNTRRSLGFLLRGLTLLGVVFAALALVQYYGDFQKILGLIPTTPAKQGQSVPFWGTLINENHAAYFLVLVNGLCFGLFLSGWQKSLHKFRNSGGAWLFYLGFSLLSSFAALMAQARGAMLLLAIQWLVILLLSTIFFVREFGLRGLFLPGIFLSIFLFGGLSFLINPDIFERLKKEWSITMDVMENPELEARYYMARISMDMFRDKPLLGHGAGSFRYTHLPYLADYPDFKTQSYRWFPNPYTGEPEKRLHTLWYQNAHVDLMEYLVEWGLIGCLFPFSAIAWLLIRCLRARQGMDPGSTVILASIFIVFLGAAIEFHMRIPLVMLAWSLAFTISVKLAELNAH